MMIPHWALTEMVTVTAVQPSMALITSRFGGITVEATEDGELKVCGVDVMATETEARIEHLCGVADSVLVGMPVMGRPVRVNAATAGR